MTLIALFEDLKTAISDCLITDKVHKSGIDLPSMRNTEGTLPSLSHKPKYLMRKCHSFAHGDQKGTFLFSGTVDDFTCFVEFFEKIRESAGATVSAENLLVDALRHSRENRRSDFTMIAVIDDQAVSDKYIPTTSEDIPYFGSVMWAGTGKPLLREELMCRGDQFAAREGDETAANEQRRALRALMSVPSIMFEHDTRKTLYTIRNAVGGYYESFHWNDGMLQPVGRISRCLFLLTTTRLPKKLKSGG